MHRFKKENDGSGERKGDAAGGLMTCTKENRQNGGGKLVYIVPTRSVKKGENLEA